MQLIVGLMGCGFGVAGILVANLGAAPWDVLSQGISHHVDLSFGTITIITGAIVLLLWIPLRQRLGVGTILNAVLIGVFADVGLWLYPEPTVFWAQLVMLTVALFVLGLGSGLYIGAGLGAGPRDGLMTGLHARTGKPIWLVRTAIEVTVLVLGWLMGGTVGIGTVLVAVLIGPLCQIFLRIFMIPKTVPRASAL